MKLSHLLLQTRELLVVRQFCLYRIICDDRTNLIPLCELLRRSLHVYVGLSKRNNGTCDKAFFRAAYHFIPSVLTFALLIIVSATFHAEWNFHIVLFALST